MRDKRSFASRLAGRALVLVFAFALLGGKPASAVLIGDSCAGVGSDAADTQASATPLQQPATVSGSFCEGDFASDTVDWYSLTLTAPGTLRVTFTHGGTNAKLYSPTGTSIAAPVGDPKQWALRAPAGRWTLQVTGGGINEYGFAYAYTQQSDCNGTGGTDTTPRDAGNTSATASEISISTTPTCSGRIWAAPASTLPATDPHDWYLVTVTAGSTLRVELAATVDYTDGCGTNCGGIDSTYAVEIRTKAGTLVGTRSTGKYPAQTARAEYPVTQTGDYLVHVFSTTAPTGDWIYSMTITAPTVPSVGLGSVVKDCEAASGDAGNTSAAATAFPEQFGEHSCTGTLGLNPPTDLDDWYSFRINQAAPVINIVGVADGTLAFAMSVYEPGATVAKKSVAVTGTAPGTMNVPGTKLGLWKLQLHRTSAAGGAWATFVDKLAGLGLPPSGIPTVSPVITDCAQSGDAGNTLASPRPLQLVFNQGTACAGTLGTPATDIDDFYSFAAAQGAGLRIVAVGDAALDVSVSVYEPGATVPKKTRAQSGATPEIINIQVSKTGTWKMQIRRASGAGNYLFYIDVVNVSTHQVGDIPPSGVPTVPAVSVKDCNLPADDAGNTNATASAAPAYLGDYACVGSLGQTPTTDADDWYKFDVTTQGFRLVASGNGVLDFSVSVYAPGATVPTKVSNQSSLNPEVINIAVPPTRNGTWRVQLHRMSGAGNYAMLIDTLAGNTSSIPPSGIPTVNPTVPPVPPVLGNADQCKGSGDAGNTSTTPHPISATTACYGNLGAPATDTQDWYSFPAAAGMDIRVVVGGEPQIDVNLALVSPAGNVFTSTNSAPQLDTLIVKATVGGTWKVQLIRANAGAGHYLLTLDARRSLVPSGIPSVTPTLPTLGGDCQKPGDAPNSYGEARLIPSDGACHGASAAITDMDDYYKFYGQAGLRLLVEYQGNYTIDNDLYIYEPDVNRVYDSESSGFSPEGAHMILRETGEYRLRLVARAGSGDYAFSIYVGF